MNNLELIIKDTEEFFYVDEKEAITLSAELTEHMRNKLYFNPTPLKVNNGVKINGNYETKNLRQSFFKQCEFENVNYYDAGLAGSLFVESIFMESNFTNTNFQSCDFRTCDFNGIKTGLNYTRFSKSIFSDTTFNDCIFNGVLMNDTIFDNCTFTNCEWIPVSIENAVFKNTTLDNLIFKSMNFEFSTFDGIVLNNVKLPFPTIPYIFNGLNYLVKTTDNVRITSAKYKDGITVEQYLENLDKLRKFYTYTHNYFPLTNILICKNMHDEAFASTLNGINLSIELRRFRMLKNYCKQLSYINNITMHDRQSLYRYILDKISKVDLMDFEYSNLKNYLPEVRQILLDDFREQKLEISLSSNIETDDAKKIPILINIIDDILKDKCEYSIEMRHNSPWDFFVQVFTDPNNISLILNAITLVFTAVQTKIALNQIQKESKDKSIKHDEIEKYRTVLIENNIVITNLTINNNGNIHVNKINKNE